MLRAIRVSVRFGWIVPSLGLGDGIRRLGLGVGRPRCGS